MYTINDFDYILSDTLIAQFPAETRTQSRLLITSGRGDCIHTVFPHFMDCVNPNDLLIFNDTRVINARLFGAKEGGGKIECLVERVVSDHQALAHVRASIAPKIGSCVVLEDVLHVTVIEKQGALYLLEFHDEKPLFELLATYGHLPLPPYITRSVAREDFDRYQTVYAKHLGAVAAPTAGLHFDEAILNQLCDKNVEFGFVTLHVGAGTFQPVRVDNIADHTMHSERITVSEELCNQIKACKNRGGRVIAIGTTVVRALESVAQLHANDLQSYTGETNIFITPGFQFRVVDCLLTNFHLPKSTLLMLVCAFAGFDRVMNAYREAVEQQYRFFSYGDAMLLC